MKYKTLYLVLKTDRPVKEEATQLRGYIGNVFSEYPVLHNHMGSPVLTYPRVQYKMVGKTPSIFGIEEGADVIKKISGEINELDLLGSRYEVTKRTIHERSVDIDITPKPVSYRFLSPWLALNSKNYESYNKISDWKKRKEFLNKILTGNILSMAKGLGIVVENRLYVHSKIDSVQTRYKSVGMTGFTGEFRVNFSLPEYCGLGKGVSQGFGALRVENHNLLE
ncbi:hypothetical protein J2128_000339 [Methanomicrobium sp. W14]|uniref:CRISPR-associated endonuclease Cas6 n=1 Tax=Methanomicrobium sp. W14 TaxID=2817839 RepID=UPI001AE79AC2|nr:CRISPR-associated endonuclease Cas6 [Methanomicrobium sp. W14]MBP2132418.1 hypothetical protein [Methanomicrobium sp. W14]